MIPHPLRSSPWCTVGTPAALRSRRTDGRRRDPAPHTGRCAGRPGPLRHGLPVRRPPRRSTCAAWRGRTATGALIPVTDEDLDALPLPTAKVMRSSRSCPRRASTSSVSAPPPTWPPRASPRNRTKLLRQALELSPKVAVAKFAMRDRERLGLLRVLDDVIVLRGMRWSDEIREPSLVDVPEVEVSDEEVEEAVALAGHPFREGSRRDARQVPRGFGRS
ncbi:Ku protein [Streptomyces cirratus]